MTPAKTAMRKRIRKELIARFRAALQRRLPQFRRHTEKSDDPIWAWRLAPNLTFFVWLQPSHKREYDEFFVELAWSDNGKYPIQEPPSGPLPEVEAPRFRERLAELWMTGVEADTWKIITDETRAELEAKEAAYERGDMDAWLRPVREVPEEEVLPLVAPAAEDAVQKLIDFGMPLFRQVAEHRGIPWPDHEVS